MLANLLITILISSQILLPLNSGEVLGVQEQNNQLQQKGSTQEGWSQPVPQRIINNNLGVKVSASNAIVIDSASNKILYDKNSNQQRPIASITKLITALVYLDTQPDLQSEIQIQNNDLNKNDGRANLLLNEKILAFDLLHLVLIASDNDATMALVRSTGLSREEFVKKMNIKAKGLGLEKTNFEDSVGLSAKNISTAFEVSQILKLAMRHSTIAKILPNKNYSFKSLSDKYHRAESTNKLLLINPLFQWRVLGGKTGFIDEAGYCFATLSEVNNHKIITVVLGSASDSERFQDTKSLIQWISENYIWK